VLTDRYYETYEEMMEATDWDALGPGRDPRCENCKIHSGFEPSATLGTNFSVSDYIRMLKWNFFS